MQSIGPGTMELTGTPLDPLADRCRQMVLGEKTRVIVVARDADALRD